MNTKLISIIVPIFNEENFIEIFLNTLKNNILKKIEIKISIINLN